MGVVNYYCTDGEILGDSQSGDYMRDALGSVTGTTSPMTATVQNTSRYKPYGTELVSSGASPTPRFQWVGTFGYRQTSISRSASYVRARHYEQEEGRWASVDPLWPAELAYSYAFGSPILNTDPFGLAPPCLSCRPAINAKEIDRKCYTKITSTPGVYSTLAYRCMRITCDVSGSGKESCKFTQYKTGKVTVRGIVVASFYHEMDHQETVFCPDLLVYYDGPGISTGAPLRPGVSCTKLKPQIGNILMDIPIQFAIDFEDVCKCGTKTSITHWSWKFQIVLDRKTGKPKCVS